MILPVKKSVVLICLLMLAPGFEPKAMNAVAGEQSADIIFIGDHIITVDAASVGVTAVAVAGQNIVATGPAKEVLKFLPLSLWRRCFGQSQPQQSHLQTQHRL